MLPVDILRHGIRPFLDSIDTMALRMTCKDTAHALYGIPVDMGEIDSGRVLYWNWIRDTIHCDCTFCRPIRAFYYTMAKRAGYRYMKHFVSSRFYREQVRANSDVFCRMLDGAVASFNISIVRLVRGSVPSVYHQWATMHAAKQNYTTAFTYLLDLGDVPARESMINYVLRHIGTHGNMVMLRRFLIHLPQDFDINQLVEATIANQHNTMLAYLNQQGWTFHPTTVNTAILYDNPEAFAILVDNGLWPEMEASRLIITYGAVRVGRYWESIEDLIGLPMLADVRLWLAGQVCAPPPPRLMTA
jgi:hypothetical protein